MERILRSILEPFIELLALWNWLGTAIGYLIAISEHGFTGGVIVWVASAVASGAVAEVINAVLVEIHIPSYLRPIFSYLLG